MFIPDLLEKGNDGSFWNAVGSISKSNCGNLVVRNPPVDSLCAYLAHSATSCIVSNFISVNSLFAKISMFDTPRQLCVAVPTGFEPAERN